MKNGIIFNLMVSLAMISCRLKESYSQRDDISGTYIMEYSFKVIHPESSDTIGLRTIRDRIFIQNQGYEVSNSKGGLNDYENEGWLNMDHADDRSFVTFSSKFDPSDSSLTNDINVKLYLDFNNQKLYRGRGIIFNYYRKTR